jgi:AraC family transcriptional activator of mtrCDE
MSSDPNVYLESPDALSAVLSGLELNAEVYVDGDFCGAWAVDTSGSRRIPFHLVGRGEAWLHMGQHPAKMLSCGDLVVFPGDAQHVIAHSGDPPAKDSINAEWVRDDGPVTNLICGFFEFKNRAAWPLLDSLSPVIHIDMSSMSMSSTVRSLLDLMMAELTRREPGFYVAINHLASLLFVQVLRQQIHNGEVDTGLLAALFDEKISKALGAIHNHPDQHWTLDSLAGKSAMGRSSFAQKFNALAGIPPMQYLTKWRMREAQILLKTTKLSIAHIAERCGYDSETAFRKAFKKTIGTPPGQTRRPRPDR